MEKIIIILIIIVIIIYLINMNSKSNELELFEDTNSLLDQNTNYLINIYSEVNDLTKKLDITPLLVNLKQGDRGKIEPLIDTYIYDTYYSELKFPQYYKGYLDALKSLSNTEKNLINKRNEYLQNMNSKSNELELFEDTNSLLDQNTNDLISLYEKFNQLIRQLGGGRLSLLNRSNLEQEYRGKIEPSIDKYINNEFNNFVLRNSWRDIIHILRDSENTEKNLINKRNQYLQN
jgi:hypothetical protein